MITNHIIKFIDFKKFINFLRVLSEAKLLRCIIKLESNPKERIDCCGFTHFVILNAIYINLLKLFSRLSRKWPD